MSEWMIFLCALCLAAGIFFLIEERHRQHELLRMKRMRGSMLYYDLYPLIAEGKKHELDQVIVERGRIVFYSMCPPGRMGEFVLSERGYRPLNAQRVWTLVQVLAEDLPILQEENHYRMQRYAMYRPNGQKDYGFQFTIRSSYKTELMYARRRPWTE